MPLLNIDGEGIMRRLVGLASGLLFLFYSASAEALPGETYGNVSKWVKNHKFLTPWLTGFSTDQEDVHYDNYEFLAFRQLQDNWFLDITLNFGGRDSKFNAEKKEVLSTLELKKKVYDKSAIDLWDKRPWRNLHCKDIWSRQDETANQLLNEVYGKQVADDFQKSKLIYEGAFWVALDFGWGHNSVLDSNLFPANASLVSERGMAPVDEGVIQILLGEKYGYIWSEKFLYLPDNEDAKCPSLTIVSKQMAQKNANILTHNLKLYEVWEQKKSHNQQRSAPANIKID